MNLAALALLDQADAATLDARAVNAGHHVTVKGFTDHATPSPYIRRALHNVDQLLGTGAGHRCAHLDPRAPSPAYWFPWKPDTFTCERCAPNLCEANLDKLNACARCRNDIVTTLHGYVRPAQLITLAGGPVAIPPILLRIGLCQTCHELEEAL